MSTESFLVRTAGGPRPGTRVAEGWERPLPELLMTEGGQYVKVSESSLEPQAEDSHVMRGAEYRWQPGEPAAGQLTSAVAVAIRTKRFEEARALLMRLALVNPAAAETIYDTLNALTGS